MLSKTDLQILIQSLSDRKPRNLPNGEIKFCCPSHDDHNPSATFNAEKQVWNCFSCQANGTALDLSVLLGLKFQTESKQKTSRSKLPENIPLKWLHDKKTSVYYNYAEHWTYLDPKNSDVILGYVVRYNSDDGTSKDLIPFFKKKNGLFVAGALTGKRPLYGAHRLISKPEAIVWIVEGEKCAASIIKLGGVALTSQGGCNAVHKSDWSIIENRKVYLWADNDEPGRKYIKTIYDKIASKNEVSIIDIDKLNLSKNQDVFDYLKLNPNADLKTLLDLPKTEINISDWHQGLMLDSKGNLKKTLFNVIRILLNHPSWCNLFGYNKRAIRPVFMSKPPIKIIQDKFPLIIQEEHIIAIAEWFGANLDLDVQINDIHDAILMISKNNQFDPVINYFESLNFDGKEIASQWLINFAGVMDTPYVRAISRKFLISAVARTYEPGCKVDTTLILQGEQGFGKSQLLRTLASDEFFTDHIEKISNKDSRMQLQGPLIIELAELDAIAKRDVSTINSFLTAQYDTFRPPYGRLTENFPRTCVFAGTTNADLFLKDETGGRRFWPVVVDKIDLKGLRVFRDKLWADAVQAYKQGEPWWLETYEIEQSAKLEQSLFRQTDPWEKTVYDFLKTTPYIKSRSYCTTEELLDDAVKVPIEKRTRNDQMRIGQILKVIGWNRSRSRVEGVRVYKYFSPKDFYNDKTEANEIKIDYDMMATTGQK